jgi:hypothetical protein
LRRPVEYPSKRHAQTGKDYISRFVEKIFEKTAQACFIVSDESGKVLFIGWNGESSLNMHTRGAHGIVKSAADKD